MMDLSEKMIIRTIDMHTGGEPLRVVLDGVDDIKGETILERRRFLRDSMDFVRKTLMWEPRGHADMYGCYIVPPNDDGADFGVIFIHNEGYSTMCGHATIALGNLAVQMGWVEVHEPITTLHIDAPCGRLKVEVLVENDKVLSTTFECVPSFVVGLDLEIDVPDLGKVKYDLAYGGAFYAYVDADGLGLDLSAENYRAIIDQGMAIKRAVMASDQEIDHPFEQDLGFLYGTIFISKNADEGTDDRNVCVFADGEVDRCPTGSGVSGRMAIHEARNELEINQIMRIESITGSAFDACYIRKEDYGPYQAVIPKVTGTSFITGRHEFIIDPDDPMRGGFLLR